MRRFLIVLFAAALSLAAAPARPGAATGNTLDLSTVAVPIVSGGRLINYVLVKVTLTLRPGTDVSHMSEKEPYFREALVRLGYHTALNPPNSFNRVDPALVSAKMAPLCQSIAGPGVVIGVEVKSQEPQKWIAAPTPTPAAASPPRPGL